ncbi:MAG: cytochrome C oxidase subunit IV family protein [Planctomycetes bacterium]|nr:cytochrome C oxidase subunit IV family protein [Planctomycetota bacterium]
MADGHAEHGHNEALEGTIGHVSNPATLVKVLITLLALTGLTVAATYVNLGRLNVIGALAIASVKASIVALWFMHLRYDKRYNFFVLVSAFALVAFFIGVVLLDTTLYQDGITEYRAQHPAAGK